MDQCLQYDSEFLAAIYNCLPPMFQYQWLNYEKSSNKWDDMMKYLDKMYDLATEQLVLLETISTPKKKEKVENPTASINLSSSEGKAKPDSKEDSKDSGKEPDEIQLRKTKERRKRVKEEIGPCPCCNQEHTYVRRDKMNWPSDRLFTCKKFKDMSAQERGTMIETLKGCPRCLSWRHDKTKCSSQVVKCSVDVGNGQKCGLDHSYLVHDSGVAYCNMLKTLPGDPTSLLKPVLEEDNSSDFANVDVDQTTVPYMQDVSVVGCDEKARVFFDEGSNRVLIRDKFAEEAGFLKKKVFWKLKVVGMEDEDPIEGNMYLAELIDTKGKKRQIWGYGIDQIMASSVPNMMCLKKYFPNVPEEALAGLKSKAVDILLGLNMNHLFPAGGKGKNKSQGMRAKTSIFGCGWVLGGCHGDLKQGSQAVFSHAASIARIAKIEVIPDEHYNVEFWEGENMGVLPPPRCERCVACLEKGTCSDRNRLISSKQQAELDVISQKTRIVNDKVYCDYPFKKDPSCLKYNREAAIKVATKVEKDLLRDGLHETYNEQVRALLERGALVKLTDQEIEEWAGPVNYIAHHPVLKDSVTTPVRMVSNSSFGNPSLNSILMKGPNSLNSMLDIMLRWRSYDCVVQYDLAKAYNTIHTGPFERNLRRIVWRFSPSDPWMDLAFDKVHFGDLCAACQLEVGVGKTAECGRDINPKAADKLKDDRYVDDGLTGGSTDEVKQLVGEKQSDGSYDGDLAKILKKGGFKIKALLVGGQEPNEESDLMGNKVLGYEYDVKNEMLSVKFSINLNKKKRGIRAGPDLNVEDLEKLRTMKLTKRLLLGVTNSPGDFLGIASPFTIKFKVLMRRLFKCEPPLHWDDAIPDVEKNAWLKLIEEAVTGDHLDFPRCTKPKNAVPNQGPVVVGTADFAEEALDARVYLRWECDAEDPSSGEKIFSAKLALCKAKVPPLDGLTIPRGELSALCLLVRLMLWVILALQKLTYTPTSAIMLVDSQCSINVVDSKKQMKPYFQNRVAEIRENMNIIRKYCELEEIQYVESKLNPSDISTRATSKLEDLGPDSFHQCGPTFFSLPRGRWPVTRDFDRKVVPEEEFKVPELKILHVEVVNSKAFQMVESIMNYSDDLNRNVRILARLMKIFYKASSQLDSETYTVACVSRTNQNLSKTMPICYSVVSKDITSEELITAEQLMLKFSMEPTIQHMKKGYLDSLIPIQDNERNIISTQGRIGDKNMLKLFGVSALPILMPNTRLAYLYMVYAHVGEFGLDHRGVASTLSRSRNKVWIVKGSILAKKVVNNCLECRRIRKKLISQQMSLIRDEQLQVAPPFTHVCLDFAGPIKVKDQVSKRKEMKGWILVYSCVATKAVDLFATAGYSTEDFLCKHDEFTARHGRPVTIVSDQGSQLMRSSIKVEEKDKPNNAFNWSSITSRDSKVRWTFVPAGGQHRNGIAEATVKVMKRSLNLALQKGEVLVYAELVTLLARIATSINSRPLSISRVSSESEQSDQLLALTPNHLLLGRSSSEPFTVEFDENDKFSKRMSYVQTIHDQWWNIWMRDVLPTLVPCKRWKKPQYNLQIGDIVMVTFPGNITNDYRIAMVTNVFPDEKKLVRTVEISYRRRNKREPPSVYRSKPLVKEVCHVQKLSLLQSASEPVYDGE